MRRQNPRPQQLALLLPNTERGRIVVTRALRSHRSCERVVERVRYVLRYFPEIGGTPIRVGLTRVANGMAVPGGNEIWLNPGHTSYHTIAHEFVHLLQRGGGVPRGERSCDVHSLARHWTLNDEAPSYVKIPPRLLQIDGKLTPTAARIVYEVACEALDRRQLGTRRYIAWFEERLVSVDCTSCTSLTLPTSRAS